MTPSPDAWCPSQAVGKVKNVAGWSSPVAREAHNLEVTGSNPVPATHFTPARPSWPGRAVFCAESGLQPGSPAVCPMAPAGCFFWGLLPPFPPAGPSRASGGLFFAMAPGLQPGSPAVGPIHGP